MDAIQNLAKCFSKEEARMFKLLSNRIASKGKKRTNELFDSMRTAEDPELSVLALSLYGKDTSATRNNLYRLRHKLNLEMQKTLLFHHFEFDSEQDAIHKLSLGKILRKKGHFRVAKSLVEKAISTSLENDLFEIADLGFEELLNLSHNDLSIDVGEIIEQREENQERINQLRSTSHSISLINYRFRKSNFSESGKDVLKTLEEIRQELSRSQKLFSSPKGRFQVFQLVSNILLTQKAFGQLQTFIEAEYQTFMEKDFFQRDTHTMKILMLIWLQNATLKNYHFEDTLKYADELKSTLLEYNKLNFGAYMPYYYLGLINAYTCMGKNDQAIRLIELIFADKKDLFQAPHLIVLNLNLAHCHYLDGKLSRALKSLGNIYTHDFFGEMAPDFQLFVYLFEAACRFENGDLEYLESRLDLIRNRFEAPLSKNPEAIFFLGCLQAWLPVYLTGKKPDISAQTLRSIRESIEGFSPGNNEVIHYGLWLDCQIRSKSYPAAYYQLINAKGKSSS